MGGTPYIGMLIAAGFNFAPQGPGSLWQLCDGSLLAISQNEAMFTLLGTTFGGDGQNTFAVPDLRGRTPIHFGNGYIVGQIAGNESVTLTTSTMPSHNHYVNASGNNQNSASPTNNYLAAGPQSYTALTPSNTVMSQSSITNEGGSVAHENRQPFLTLNWIIARTGIYPSQS